MENPESFEPKRGEKFSYFEFLGEIQPKRELAQPNTIKRLEQLGGEFEEVAVGQAVVSENPIVSYAFGHCKGLVVRQGDKMGLAHLLCDQDPDQFVAWIKDQLDTDQKITAITVVDDNDGKIRRVCEQNGIEVENTIIVDGDIYKDVIAVPKTGQITICFKDRDDLEVAIG